LKIFAIRDAIQRSNIRARNFNAPGWTRTLPMKIVEGLGNGLYFPDGLRGSAPTVGRCIFEDTAAFGLDEKLAKYDLLFAHHIGTRNCSKPIAKRGTDCF